MEIVFYKRKKLFNFDHQEPHNIFSLWDSLCISLAGKKLDCFKCKIGKGLPTTVDTYFCRVELCPKYFLAYDHIAIRNYNMFRIKISRVRWK